jgi:hypothetical protein
VFYLEWLDIQWERRHEDLNVVAWGEATAGAMTEVLSVVKRVLRVIALGTAYYYGPGSWWGGGPPILNDVRLSKSIICTEKRLFTKCSDAALLTSSKHDTTHTRVENCVLLLRCRRRVDRLHRLSTLRRKLLLMQADPQQPQPVACEQGRKQGQGQPEQAIDVDISPASQD